MPEPSWTARALAVARLDRDPAQRPPAGPRVVVATLVALALSLALDAALVAAGTALFPSMQDYPHFRLSDYGLLTAIGVVAAGAAWPVTARLGSAPRWLFLRLAVLVTLVLWLPDLWILTRGQNPRAVAVLAVMHLGIALVTYNVLVRLAPLRPPGGPAPSRPPRHRGDPDLRAVPVRPLGLAMEVLVILELALGIVTLAVVPYHRPGSWLPARGLVVYLSHAVLGAALGLGAAALVLLTRRAGRIPRLGAVVGIAGVATAALGGLASAPHATRLVGVGLMLVGTVVAGFGYLMVVMRVGRPERQ